MRAEFSTIQQTLTPEAATVLNQSIAEAGRRNHGQTTPLHVAATLLSSSSGILRQACIKSHPNSSHPLQCRALELCFSVALDRLPAARGSATVVEPPISNALMAALKRAQAHQRRGCPEQQQQPLLAVKAELEQLVLSVLDDPSVSRVMREASFSSLAVKATIEQSLSASGSKGVSSSSVRLGFRPPGGSVLAAPVNQNMYLNPRLQQQSGVSSQAGQQRGEDVKRVVEILVRSKKRNPVLVGETEPEMVIKEVLRRIESNELAEGALKDVEVIRFEEFLLDRVNILAKISELDGLSEERIGSSTGNRGVILYLGDLKWLVEQPVSLRGVNSSGVPQQVVSEVGKAAVVEMAKLLAKFGEGGNGGTLWLIGSATCETYLRCQVYHPSMENDWDLQAIPIAAKAPLSGKFPMLGSNRIKITPMEPLSLQKGFPAAPAVLTTLVSENLDHSRKLSCCPDCMKNYEKELSTFEAKELKKSELSTESAKSRLPQWLQNAKVHDGDVKTSSQTQTKEPEMLLKQKTQELQKKWKDVCSRSHPNFHQRYVGLERIIPTPLAATSLYNPKLLQHQTFQSNLQVNRNLGGPLQLKPITVTCQPPLQTASTPRSPVRTELALGRTKAPETMPQNTPKEKTRDFLGHMPDEPQNMIQEVQSEKVVSMLDADFFKRLIKGLIEKVWWQREAASVVATSVIQCKVGNGKRRSNGDIWLFFTGPDSVGKRKMATALSELVNGAAPIIISLRSRRSDGEPDMSFRGKTAVDRIVEAVRRNPFSVVMLEDIDEADVLVRGSIKRAVERGRFADSHGREISLGNVIFLVTANWMPDNTKNVTDGQTLDDGKLANLASKGLQLRLSLLEKTVKRRANWLHDDHRNAKSRKDSNPALSFDLNEAVDVEDGTANSSHNSSDLTIDYEVERGLLDKRLPIASSFCGELQKCVDDTIVFKQVELGTVQCDIANLITKRFCGIMDDNISFEVQDNALEKVLGGLWVSGTTLEEWTEKVLVPSFRKLKSHFLATDTGASSEESSVFRLEVDEDSDNHGNGDWLPSSIKLLTNVL